MANPIIRQSDDKTEPDAIDFETACFILMDMRNREPWSVPRTMAQWVAIVRRYGQDEARGNLPA